MNRPELVPARPGDPVREVDTPALLVDLDALEGNIRRMAGVASAARVRLRPHAKAHKSPDIARLQIGAGAVGVCCQKLAEAETMADHGIADILLTYEIVGETKLARLAALAARTRLSVIADHADQVAGYSRAAKAAGVTLSVLVDICPGGMRTGVDAGEPAAALAKEIAAATALRFGGLQAYNGAAQHLRTAAERSTVYEAYARQVAETRDLLARDGLPCETITGAGTGTCELEARGGVFNEIQPGSYVFMDADYAANGASGFEQSLFILATVMSAGRPGFAVVDAGTKAANVDVAMPLVLGHAGARYAGAADEHGKIALDPGAAPLRLGGKLRLVPGHCDPTVNLYDWLVCFRGEVVEAVWPVAARGALL